MGGSFKESLLDELERNARENKLKSIDEFLSKDEGYIKYGKPYSYMSGNIDKYKEFVNIEIINILEAQAEAKKRMDYSAFVKKQRGEPNMTDDRVRNFRETGYYIDEYEKYVKGGK